MTVAAGVDGRRRRRIAIVLDEGDPNGRKDGAPAAPTKARAPRYRRRTDSHRRDGMPTAVHAQFQQLCAQAGQGMAKAYRRPWGANTRSGEPRGLLSRQ